MPQIVIKLFEKDVGSTSDKGTGIIEISHDEIEKEGFEKFKDILKHEYNHSCLRELFPKLETRKVIRLTLIKGVNMNHPEKYAELIKKAKPDFIEAKAWMCVGGSSLRLSYDNMPSHEEVKEFAKKIAELIGYKLKDESKPSRVVLLEK